MSTASTSTGSTTATVAARDGVELLVRRWSPATGAWASVLVVHGIHEHSGRYERVGAWLAAAGLDVTAYDLRGFGASGGRRAYVSRWRSYEDDLEDRLAAVRAEASGRPVVLFGHSLGGLLVLGYLLAQPARPGPDLAVVSAPAIASSTPGWQRLVASVLDRVAPRFTLMDAFDGALLSRDEAIGVAYSTDPLSFHGTTARLGAEALRQQRLVQAATSRLHHLGIPLLVYHGDADRIVPVASTAPLGTIAGVTRRTYPGLRHESHNEPEGEQVIGDVVAWIRSVLQSTDN